MDLTDTLDEIVDTVEIVVADTRSWRPSFENASVAVSVEPISFERRSLAGRYFHLEAELVLTVGSADTRSAQGDAHRLALAVHDRIDQVAPSGGGIGSWNVRETRFVRPGGDTTPGAVLILDVEVEWT